MGIESMPVLSRCKGKNVPSRQPFKIQAVIYRSDNGALEIQEVKCYHKLNDIHLIKMSCLTYSTLKWFQALEYRDYFNYLPFLCLVNILFVYNCHRLLLQNV